VAANSATDLVVIVGVASRRRLLQRLLLVPCGVHTPHSVYHPGSGQRCAHQRHEASKSSPTPAALQRFRLRTETTLGMPSNCSSISTVC